MITSCRTNDGSVRLKIDLLVWWRYSTSIGSGQHISNTQLSYNFSGSIQDHMTVEQASIVRTY